VHCSELRREISLMRRHKPAPSMPTGNLARHHEPAPSGPPGAGGALNGDVPHRMQIDAVVVVNGSVCGDEDSICSRERPNSSGAVERRAPAERDVPNPASSRPRFNSGGLSPIAAHRDGEGSRSVAGMGAVAPALPDTPRAPFPVPGADEEPRTYRPSYFLSAGAFATSQAMVFSKLSPNRELRFHPVLHFRRIEEDERAVADPAALAPVRSGGFQPQMPRDESDRIVHRSRTRRAEIEDVEALRLFRD